MIAATALGSFSGFPQPKKIEIGAGVPYGGVTDLQRVTDLELFEEYKWTEPPEYEPLDYLFDDDESDHGPKVLHIDLILTSTRYIVLIWDRSNPRTKPSFHNFYFDHRPKQPDLE